MKGATSMQAKAGWDWTLARRALSYVWPYRWLMGAALLMIAVLVVAANVLPVIVMRAIDLFLVNGDGALSVEARFRGVTRQAGLYVLCAFAVFAARYGQTYLMTWVGQRIMSDLRNEIFIHVLRLPFAFFDRTPVGRLMTRLTSDVTAMQQAFTDGLLSLVADAVTLLGILGFMFFISPRLALVVLVLVPVLFVVIIYINRRTRAAHRNVRREESALNAFLQEALTGMQTVQLFGTEQVEQERFGRVSGALREHSLTTVRFASLYFPAVEALGAGTMAVMLCAGGAMMLMGVGGCSAGIIVAFLMYIREFFRPIEDLAEKSNSLQSALASAERIFELLDEPRTVDDPEQPETLETFHGRVEFDGVWFAYADDDWVLKDLNIDIAPGQSVALVGATGAGKTSIASLLARFYDVQRGAVRVDGHDVRDLRQADLRKRIGIVLQDPFIFAGSVADNIGLHNPDLSREDLVQAARYVNADAFISALPAGYDTEVHERGVGLSTGQKQLVALARALAQNPDILLILDEATASVDTETELLIRDALSKLMHGRTTLIIAHRLSTIQHVDRILVMRHGELVEEGSHADLIEAGGYYRRLYELLSRPAPVVATGAASSVQPTPNPSEEGRS